MDNKQTKHCVKCKEFRLLTEYSKNKYRLDGLFWVCKSCEKEYYTKNYKPVKCEWKIFREASKI